MSLGFGSYFDTDEMLCISIHFRLFIAGRRHYIRTVKMFNRKPSMLYNMIVRPLIHCWDDFEENVKITSPGPEI